MTRFHSRRAFLRDMGMSSLALPFICNMPSLAFANAVGRKQRLVVIFSPNGVVPDTFWPDAGAGADFKLKESMSPFEPFRDQMLVLKGVCDKVRGDGDNHMRGMGCLLTGVELFPGNVQGGSDTPAGWSSGISIDQQLKRKMQQDAAKRTRFGTLEFGVLVPNRADTWTRMVYAGPNKPIAPIDDPYQMFQKLYGQQKDQEHLRSVLDALQQDLKKVGTMVSSEDRHLLEEHAQFVREMEQELQASKVDAKEKKGDSRPEEEDHADDHAIPELEPGIKEEMDNMPRISRMNIDLMVNSFVADFTRIATFQYTNSVGQAKMKWIGIEEDHHNLSHKPNSDADAQEKLTKINKWFAGEIAYLAKRLKETPEPGGQGSLLDNTTIIWTNELGQGNSHTLDNIPFVMIGGGLNFKMGRSVHYPKLAHNRLLMSISEAMGYPINTFGNPDFCGDGGLPDLT